MKPQRVLVVCSISDVSLRKSLYRHLANLGLAIIPGVYECMLTHVQAEHLKDMISNLQLAGDDFVIAYHLSEICHKAAFGNVKPEDDPFAVII